MCGSHRQCFLGPCQRIDLRALDIHFDEIGDEVFSAIASIVVIFPFSCAPIKAVRPPPQSVSR